MEEWLSENAWVVGAALSPILLWFIRTLAKPLHALADRKLPDGELKDVLIDDDYEEKKAANPNRYKTTEPPEDR